MVNLMYFPFDIPVVIKTYTSLESYTVKRGWIMTTVQRRWVEQSGKMVNSSYKYTSSQMLSLLRHHILLWNYTDFNLLHQSIEAGNYRRSGSLCGEESKKPNLSCCLVASTPLSSFFFCVQLTMEGKNPHRSVAYFLMKSVSHLTAHILFVRKQSFNCHVVMSTTLIAQRQESKGICLYVYTFHFICSSTKRVNIY